MAYFLRQDILNWYLIIYKQLSFEMKLC